MKRISRLQILFVALFCSFAFVLFITWNRSDREERELPDALRDREEYANAEERRVAKKARADYFFMLLRDPATNTIPDDIRRRELAYARTLPHRGDTPAKSSLAPRFRWNEAGPTDVGGRTRAVAVDRNNPSTILAGGVAGGIWKSTNGGTSWALKSDPDEVFGITYITQDPRPGNGHLWYATTGEFIGSNWDRGLRAPFYGSGILRSVDNGESWTLVEDPTPNRNPISFDSPYDYGLKILVSPTTGTVFLASNGFGVSRTTNPVLGVTRVLGKVIFPEWSDIDMASNGAVIAVTSNGFFKDENPTDGTETPGVFYSTNDGLSWQDITPDDYPAEPERSMIAFAPSDPTVAYMFTFTGAVSPSNNAFEEEEEVQFYAFDLDAGASENRSANLPDFGGQVSQVYTQGNYNMMIAVHPDEPNHVFIGGTNLYRSRDGFATPANSILDNWIGGYATANNISQYKNHHPDQHALFFDSNNPDAAWSAHDGGLSFVSDISPSATALAWGKKNDGFVTTQFFHVSIPPQAGDNRILGGTQDNGSLFFRYDPLTMTGSASDEAFSGDGTYAYLGNSYAIASTQSGSMFAFRYDASGNLIYTGEITPPGASNQLFVNPFSVDKRDENVLYYPGGNKLWRRGADASSPTDWDQLTSITLPAGYSISALATGVRNGASVLYFGASGIDVAPKLYRLDQADTATGAATEISIAGVDVDDDGDAYIHGIAVNPSDGNEILAVMSNYNIVGAYHSADAGASYSPVEGNLQGTTASPGPSLRSAAILPANGGAIYLIGTSVGVFSTETLAGNSTVWEQEAADELGSAIVEFVTARPADGRVALATHGRGVFLGTPLNPVPIEEDPVVQPGSFALGQNYPNPFNPSTTISFSLAQASRVSLAVFDVTGRHVETLLDGDLKEPGQHDLDFFAGALSSGSYIYRLEATPIGASQATFKESKVMVLSK